MIGNQKELINYLLLQDKDKKFEIKEYHEKRSLDANAYCWQLLNKIGNILHKSKEEVYLQMLKDYGQNEVVSMLSSINVDGYFKYYEPIGSSILNGKEFTHYRIFKGSSEYNTKEMSILIDGIVQEAEQLGIATITDKQINELKASWKNEE
jgi:hypothetical protein